MSVKEYMFNSLSDFYRSKEWRKILQQLRMERINEQGEIICEYCEKPITKAYDMIGHHKIELTEENVNDFDVSLNPQNIQFVHHRCHNYIHNKLGYSVREVFLIYGAPLSGKTTWTKENMNEGDLIVDMDSIWECVSGCNRYIKPNRLKSVVFKMRDTMLDAVRYRLGRWNNAYIIGGYPLQSERERLIKELGAREIFIECSKNECLARLENIEDGRDKEEWKKFIEDWFDRYSPPLSD